MNSYIKGSVREIFYKTNNGFMVGVFKIRETNDKELEYYLNKSITFSGNFHELLNDTEYKFYGEPTQHPKYGFQYKVSYYEKLIPEEKNSIISFLSSGMFPGIGLKTATKIVEKFGDKTLDIILEDYNNLLLIPSLKEEKAKMIYDILYNEQLSYKTILYLEEKGFSVNESVKIYEIYKENTINVIENDIYSIINDEITFTKVDFLRNRLHIEDDDIRRVKACTFYIINELIYETGNTYLDKESIIKETQNYLNIEFAENEFDQIFEELQDEDKIEIVDEMYYLKDMYLREEDIVRKLKKIKMNSKTVYKKLDKEIENLEMENGISYNELQKEAIKKALEKNLLIITGGPGTGKTTIIKAIVALYKRLNKLSYDALIHDLALLAPTGRASKRMSETTLYPASTIHRFLKWNKENNTFAVCENNKDKSKLIIVDESSMIDINLFSSLLRGLTSNIKLILVGDYDQLPSVGPGLILKDLIESGKIETIKLEYLYRQDKSSYINILAKEIKENNLSEDSFKDYTDYRFLKCNSPYITESIRNICIDLIKHGYDYKRVQVMAPMYKGENGIDNLNATLQEVFNPKSDDKKEIKISNIIYRVNDKILELVNMPDENVFNGDIGILKDIVHPPFSASGKTEIYVDFDGNVVKYLPKDLIKIKHGFAISIHKSQGGEFEFVIIPIIKNYNRMLYRKLVYTGITRAKKKLVLLGDPEALQIAASSNYGTERKTNLKNLIIECFE